ncbi:MAG: SDR family oxidoreductase [Ilumatobacteraceae bacterium]|nr:SDR family oxidoreductase [Ilumatobacteraceae bacterium]
MSDAPQYVSGHGLLENKAAVITAAAGSGIGSATARRFVEEGARVIISDRHERRLAEMADELGVVGVPCDVTDETSVRELVSTASEQLGSIDVWVNNAGLGGSALITEMSDDQWFGVLDVTLTGTFRCLRAVLSHMYEQKSGVVINNASVLGWRAQAEQAHYAAAKAGVMALTRCASIEAADHGVRVNAVAPSLAMHENLSKVTSDELLVELTAREALKRAAHPWEISNVMVFLASDYSSYLTGEVISVSAQHP